MEAPTSNKATIKSVEWLVCERLKAALVAKLAEARATGADALEAGLLRAIQHVHDFIKHGGKDVARLKVLVAAAVRGGDAPARRPDQARPPPAPPPPAAAPSPPPAPVAPHGGKLAALQDKRGFSLADPNARWTIPNDLLEKQARAIHNEYLTMAEARTRMADETEAARAAARRAAQRATVATLDAQVAAKAAAKAAAVGVRAREQAEMDSSLVALQATLVKEHAAKAETRAVFNAAQRELVELTKARKRAEKEADEEDNRERLQRILDANAADAARAAARAVANRATLRQVQVDNVRRKTEQVTALVAQQHADVELARANELVLAERAAARLRGLDAVREMQRKKFLAAGGDALEKGLAERMKESESKAAREAAAAESAAAADAARREAHARGMKAALRATLGEQMAERAEGRERQRAEMVVAKAAAKEAMAALKAELRNEKAAKAAAMRALNADMVSRIKAEKAKRFEGFEDHMGSTELALNQRFFNYTGGPVASLGVV